MRIERQVAKPLADRLMRGGGRDEMGETFEGGHIAVLQILRAPPVQSGRNFAIASLSDMFVLRTFVLYAIFA